ncbi:acyl-CoA synthetase (AMP-forming)/AMP-acid ligase II, partial [Chitinivorax tropicus]
MSHPENFVCHLRHLAAARPQDTALVIVREQHGQPDELVLDYATLDMRVRQLAARLQAFPRGERVLLAMDNDEHYVISFFACLYAGLIAVPVCPPESTRQPHLARLIGIIDDAAACCVLTTRPILPLIEAVADRSSGLTIWLADEAVDAGPWAASSPAPTDIAFLQYTSGSTSTPKGVMVSHANLMANERAIEEGFSVASDDVFVSWLPLFHDMGLIGGLLQAIHRGCKCVLMSPRFFLERPIRWLQTISRHRATISGGPDFSYRMCLERIPKDKLETLDLSCWRVAFSGAEPIRHDTLQEFITHFAPAGLDAQAVYPCYGLAEATLFVSGGVRGSGLLAPALSRRGLAQGQARPAMDDEESLALVACGRVPSLHQVAIVDASTFETLPDGFSGEIWASGPSIASGYWRNAEATQATFVEKEGQRWLRTGDLGFWRDGQLYINGRLKDLIIIRGHNLYPQDIERHIEEQIEAVRAGRVAAFAVRGPQGEGIGIAAEISRGMQKLVSPATLVEALSVCVSELCGEPLSVVALLNPGALPKTSSGKLQRHACATGWESGSLDSYAIYAFGQLQSGAHMADASGSAPPLHGTSAELAALWRATLRLPEQHVLHADSHFFASGGNSLAMVQLAARLRQHWQIVPTLAQLFEHPRLADMANWLEHYRQSAPACSADTIPARSADWAIDCPASPAQQRQYFLWQYQPDSSAYHIAAARRLIGPLDIPALQSAFDHLVTRHESLRTVFRTAEDGTLWQQVQSQTAFAVALHDLRTLDAADRQARCQQLTTALQHTPFDLAHGPLLRVGLLRETDETALLVVVMHHIVSDGWSMRLIVEAFVTAYQAAVAGQPVAWPPLPIQYADYALWQRQWLEAGERQRQLDYWCGVLGTTQPVLQLPTDR